MPHRKEPSNDKSVQRGNQEQTPEETQGQTQDEPSDDHPQAQNFLGLTFFGKQLIGLRHATTEFKTRGFLVKVHKREPISAAALAVAKEKPDFVQEYLLSSATEHVKVHSVPYHKATGPLVIAKVSAAPMALTVQTDTQAAATNPSGSQHSQMTLEFQFESSSTILKFSCLAPIEITPCGDWTRSIKSIN